MIINTTRQTDPTRTTVLRRMFIGQMNKRFRELKGAIWKSVATNDCFALKKKISGPAIRTLGLTPIPTRQFEYLRSDQKAEAFGKWLVKQEKLGVLEVINKPDAFGRPKQAWTDSYVQSSYQKGIKQARQDLINEGVNIPNYDRQPSTGFASAFNQPIHMDRLGLVYSRTFTQLKGITAEMDHQISHVLTQGILEGKGPYEIARQMNKRVDITLMRAKRIARTEIIKAHNHATLLEFEMVENIIGEKIKVQWMTAGDSRVRPWHAELHGEVMTRDEAMGLLGEPNCRCTILPYIDSKRKAGKSKNTKYFT